MKNKNFLLIATVFFCISCNRTILQPKIKSDATETSPGMNGGVFEAKEVTPNQTPNAKNSYVDLALKWLANHQEEDGHWDTGKYEGKGDYDTNIASTGAAQGCFILFLAQTTY